jgi:hypothetical protein
VIIGRADTVAEPDCAVRVAAEQRSAIEQHNLRVLVARLLAAERLLAPAPPWAGE